MPGGVGQVQEVFVPGPGGLGPGQVSLGTGSPGSPQEYSSSNITGSQGYQSQVNGGKISFLVAMVHLDIVKWSVLKPLLAPLPLAISILSEGREKS